MKQKFCKIDSFHRAVVLIGFAFMGSVSASAQLNENSLYYKALEAYLIESDKAYSTLIKNRDFRHVRVLQNGPISGDIPKKIGGYEIEAVSEADLLHQLNRRDAPKELVIAELRAMKNEGELLIVSVGEYVARKRDGRLVLGLSGGIHNTFAYDCSASKFVLRESRLFGI